MFIRYNNNPKGKKTGDCVIRAISFATNTAWADTYRALAELGIKNCLILNDTNNWKKYLKQLGYEQQKMPRKDDRTRYTLDEFCNKVAQDNTTYIVSIAKHLTVVKDKNIYDSWNCGNKCVGNYWIIERSN